MLNLLRFESRKLFRSRSFWVCLAILSIIVVASLLTVAQLTSMDLQEVEIGKDNQGMTIFVEGEQEYSGKYVLVSVLSGQVPLILSVFIPLFIAADFSQGIIKNTIVKGYSRISIFISKLFAIFVSTLILTVVCMALACITGTIIWGFGGDVDANLCFSLLTQFVVVFALSCLYVLISIIVRKQGIAIAVSVVSMTVINMIFSLLANILDEPKIKEYHLINILSSISDLNISNDFLSKALIVSMVYIVILTSISLLYFKKADA